jgi:TfoX/Sxy family transcriptional regulator of competence genes
MAYDQQLLERIRALLITRKDVVEKKMFGGVAFMVRGNMACGPHGKNLIVRIGDTEAARAMKEPYVRPMDFTGKVLKSFATIEAEGIKSDGQLRRWVEMAASYAESLTADKKNRPSRRTRRSGAKRSAS